MLPVASGIASKTIGNAVKAKIPTSRTPFLATKILSRITVDGAVLESLTPLSAWAKYALPKGLPTEGRVLAIENDPHLVDDFDGVIGEGYGKGRKTLLLSTTVIAKVQGRTFPAKVNYHIHEADRAGVHYDIVVEGIKPGTEQWEINIPSGSYKGRYAFIKTGPIGSIVTRMKDQGVLIPKPAYTLRKEELLPAIDLTKVIVERKIDGSLGNASVQDSRVYFRSHREGGETYYDRLPTLEFLRNESSFALSRYIYPGPNISGTVFQGELSHPDGAARVSGILNSLPQNARFIQQVRGPVRFYVWDILKYKGRDVSTWPYSERRALYERVVKEIRLVNKYWDVVEALKDESPKEFYERVTNDPLPWGEGIVIKPRDLSDQKWDKLKMTGFGYFKLVDILPGEGKYANNVGRLLVENTENGAKGEVGSLAVPDDFRNWMWNHRSDLVGEVVKVRSQEVTARGVPRAGVFYGFHDSDVDLLMAAEAKAAGTDRSPKEVMYAMKSAAGWRKA